MDPFYLFLFFLNIFLAVYCVCYFAILLFEENPFHAQFDGSTVKVGDSHATREKRGGGAGGDGRTGDDISLNMQPT